MGCSRCIALFHSYISFRSVVHVLGKFSSKIFMFSDVSQGSTLAPFCLIFTNDMYIRIQRRHPSLFSDDLKMYRLIKSVENLEMFTNGY
jgi:hypothetical protein